jgi:hypothetical protein
MNHLDFGRLPGEEDAEYIAAPAPEPASATGTPETQPAPDSPRDNQEPSWTDGAGPGQAAPPDGAPGTAPEEEPAPDDQQDYFAGPGRTDPGAEPDRPGPGDRRSPVGRRSRRRLTLALAGAVIAGAAAAAAHLAGRAPASMTSQSQPSPAAAAAQGRAPSRPAVPTAAAAPAVHPAPPAPVTLAQAKEALAAYTAANNTANAQRSAPELATVETGASYAIDAGTYLSGQGTPPFPAFAPAQAAFYIPRGESATGPRWFAVQVANAFTAQPQNVTSREYLVFTQQAPGGPWLQTAEPYLLPGAGAPQVAVGADGLATAVSPGDASLAVAPGRLPAATAAAIDRTAAGPAQPAIAAPGHLADVSDEHLWQQKLPGDKVTDTHAPATGADGQEFALKTAGGGALVFYADAAQLTLTAPAGQTLHFTIPGFYPAAGPPLPAETVTYLDQFAAYDPPAGGEAPQVIAGYSGITGKD